MMNSIVIFFRLLIAHKWKILLTLTLTIWFIVLLFPFNDLNDTVTTQISRNTNNQIFLQFEKLSFNPFSATATVEGAYVETPFVAPFTTDSVSISPSLSALFSLQPDGTIKAKGFLKGDVEAHLKSLPKNAAGVHKYKIDLSGQNINVKDLRELASLSLPLKGKMQFNAQIIADQALIEQPEADLSLTIQNFELPSSAINLQAMGSVNLPEIKLGIVELKGKLAAGKFLIESGKVGTPKDDFYGDIKGDMGITFQNTNGYITPILGAYNISVDLKANAAFKERAKFFLGFLDGYKTDLAGGSTAYKFKIQAASTAMTPQFTPLR